ncbi:hypothetical protein EXIGLDRAFT_696009 [Exidia glandulosa HHB12029]|uniref:Uncharacterized protein n=1 Tax=Exidia glandulosa HHB12029 TaxID=1314781 RepID=A0A165QI77_EXIGL|nr:hypothetical protein EXIGLDRAFT_696009 [Exidia glandulosa HHB12029]
MRTISPAAVCPASPCDRPMQHSYDVRHGRNERCVELEIDGKGRPSIQLTVNNRDYESISMEDSNGLCRQVVREKARLATQNVVASQLRRIVYQGRLWHNHTFKSLIRGPADLVKYRVPQHGTMSECVYNLVAENSAA